MERIRDDWVDRNLLEAGVPEEIIDDSPELIALAKKGLFTVRSEWVEHHFQKHPLALSCKTKHAASRACLTSNRGVGREDELTWGLVSFMGSGRLVVSRIDVSGLR